MKKHYAVFIADYTIWNSPSLINLLNTLKTEGVLSVFVTNTFNRNIDFLRSNHFHYFIIEKIPFSFSLKNMYYQCRSLCYFLRYKISSRKFDFNISIDVKGFCQFLALGNKNRPLIYYSLELQLLNDKDPDQIISFLKPFQEIERKNLKYISATIIQSEARKKAFYHDFQFSSQIPCFILPVTYQGRIIKDKKNYIREKYQISNDKNIILYMGGIHPYYKVKEIVLQLAKSKDSVLFLHGYYESTYISEIMKLVQKNQWSNIVFSREIFSDIDDTNIIYQSADIGIAWYEYASMNFKTAAWSSGKISGYLRFGLPVIINVDSGGKEAISDKNCGIAIENFDEILPAVASIIKNHEQMAKSCYDEFENRYQFMNYQKELINFIDAL